MDDKRSTTLLEDTPSPTREFGNGGPERPRRGWLWIVVLILIAAAAYFLWSRSSGQQAGSAPPAGGRGRGAGATPVVAVKAHKGDIGVYVLGLGAAIPLHTVAVKTQIGGYLMKVLYQEGDIVHQDDLLAQIDPRPYQVQLESGEAALARDQAILDNARVDLTRYQTLLTHNAVPEQQYATQEATVKQDEGIVKADQATIDSAKLNLVYCNVTAPITGRVGLRLVDPGNYVTPGDSTPLVVITQLQPITVVFPIAEDQLEPVLEKWRSGERLQVQALDRTMKQLAAGKLTTIDNQIDPTTGTVKLRATFDNANNELFPNQFINARLLVEEKHGVTLLSTAAIQRNTQQTYVFLVKPDSTVTVRQITEGTKEGDLTEVVSGLNPEDTVVMSGVDKLQEGSKVTVNVENANPSSPPNQTPGGARPAGAKPHGGAPASAGAATGSGS